MTGSLHLHTWQSPNYDLFRGSLDLPGFTFLLLIPWDPLNDLDLSLLDAVETPRAFHLQRMSEPVSGRQTWNADRSVAGSRSVDPPCTGICEGDWRDAKLPTNVWE